MSPSTAAPRVGEIMQNYYLPCLRPSPVSWDERVNRPGKELHPIARQQGGGEGAWQVDQKEEGGDGTETRVGLHPVLR